MADNVNNDVCSYNGKSISTSTSSLKQIDPTQTNQQQQQNHHHHQHPKQHRRNVHQQFDDEDHKPISHSTDVSILNTFYFPLISLLYFFGRVSNFNILIETYPIR